MAAEEEVPSLPAGGHPCPEACQGLVGQEDGGGNEEDKRCDRHSEVVPLPPHTAALPAAATGSHVSPEDGKGSSGKGALQAGCHGLQGYHHSEPDPWVVGEGGVPPSAAESG